MKTKAHFENAAMDLLIKNHILPIGPTSERFKELVEPLTEELWANRKLYASAKDGGWDLNKKAK